MTQSPREDSEATTKSKSRRMALVSIALVVSVLGASCAELVNQPGQAALLCGAAGAVVGSVIENVTGGWKHGLSGGGLGALLGATACFAIAEYRSRQIKDYQETRRAINYQPSAGDIVQITDYEITPSAAAPGDDVQFKATYYVMTPNAEENVLVNELRIIRVYDPARNEYRELGRAPSPVTVKPGTRQADGKFQVRSKVEPGQYQIVFQITKETRNDSKELPLIVTLDQAILAAGSNRSAQVVAAGGEPSGVNSGRDARAAAGRSAASSSGASNRVGAMTPGSESSDAPLAALGEGGAKALVAANPDRGPARYFVASKVSSTGNLRQGPGTTHAVVGQIKEGERFPIIDRTTSSGEPALWYKIRLENGLEAWVAGSLGTEVQQ